MAHALFMCYVLFIRTKCETFRASRHKLLVWYAFAVFAYRLSPTRITQVSSFWPTILQMPGWLMSVSYRRIVQMFLTTAFTCNVIMAIFTYTPNIFITRVPHRPKQYVWHLYTFVVNRWSRWHWSIIRLVKIIIIILPILQMGSHFVHDSQNFKCVCNNT